MSSVFGNPVGTPFSLFGQNHLIVLAVYIAGLILLIVYPKKLIAHPSMVQGIRWALFAILTLAEVSYQIWAVVHGVWNARGYLPLHLCGIAGLVAATALLTYHKKLIQITYFIAFIPALLAVLTPELIYDFPHYRFWKFFIHHMAISWSGLFLILTSQVAITWRSMWTSYAYLLVYAALVGFFINPWLNANFLFLARATSAFTLLNFLGSGVWYYVNLCLITLGAFSLLVPFSRLIKK
ncbi:hypothetical protein JNUCC1_02023 [Lentibacillus sp. JNUCC-1]|uniref:YwaF family protein n=1 Tax=Lentibacillus sp. JNUCC-1 TaxID=2654513 RepID=UPI0012E83B40|nr:hypothetical protein [Lentibacillus sp. JNUCC-1]